MECQKCGLQHEGSYGSGRFCSSICKNQFNLQKVTIHRARIDISNQRFGHLVALHPDVSILDPSGRKRTSWVCRCDCGRSRKLVTEKLRSGEVTNCCHKECNFHRPLYYDSSTESSFNSLLLNYKTNARKKKRKFELTKEEFRTFTQGDCFYCGCKPSARWTVARGGDSKTDAYIFNGIDRVDSSKEYTMDNCVSCCKRCNIMKMELTVAEFLDHLQNVVNHWRGGKYAGRVSFR